MVIPDDELIIKGLLYDEYHAYEDARQIYAKLFDRTKEDVYLFKEVTASLLGMTHIKESINRLKDWEKLHIDALKSKRLLIPLYLSNNQINLAKDQAEYLIEQSKNLLDLELASNPFLYSGEYKRAISLLSKVYRSTLREGVLLRMVDIMDEYTNERKQAIQLLETHRRMHITSNDVLVKLLILYSKEKDMDGMLETYKALYTEKKDEKILAKIIDIYMYKRDTLSAISFLEKYQVGDDVLYNLYKSKKLLDKALKMSDRKYKETKDARWIAEKAILIFEKAKDKDDKLMIIQVASLFDKALHLGIDDSIYLNYYGYTLIDKEIDVSKGVQIIQNALIQQPDNPYYLDSLAWGYFKMNECKKAYKLMKRVVDIEGLKESEITEHWKAIKKCK